MLVITGAGRAFCRGRIWVMLRGYGPRARAERGICAAVEGDHRWPDPDDFGGARRAAGAGANLALAADVVIATESASFIQAFTRMAGAGCRGQLLAAASDGLARAMGSVLFADKVTARQAADWGMIYESVPDQDFSAHWQARALALANGRPWPIAA